MVKTDKQLFQELAGIQHFLETTTDKKERAFLIKKRARVNAMLDKMG